MKRERIKAYDFSPRRTITLFLALISLAPLFGEPSVRVENRKKLEYERPSRLEEEDGLKGTVFQFGTGLEIICDIEYVKVYIFDLEAGRTPYENNSLSTGYSRISLEKPGYEDLSFWVNIRNDYRTTVFVNYKSPEAPPETQLESSAIQVKTGPVYTSINPGDPAYYRRLMVLSSEDSSIHSSAEIKNSDQEYVITLLPEQNKSPFVFTWDGRDTLEKQQTSGEYRLQMVPGERLTVELTKAYSRKPLSYWSGSAGYLLSPTAQIIFPGGFQFGSTVVYESLWESTTDAVPLSFFVRLSPVKRWEAAFETEIAFINEMKIPSIRLSTSQKVQVFGNELFQMALGLKGGYKSSISDFSDSLESTIIRDPGGISFFIPCQFDLNNWDLVVTPEILYTFDSLPATGAVGSGDILSVLRWGVAYSEDIFGATLSAALFIPFDLDKNIVTQVGVEGYLYIPDSPMYLSLFFMNQGVENEQIGESLEGYACGLNLGFLF